MSGQSRQKAIFSNLADIVKKPSDIDIFNIDPDTNIFQLGIDSMMLTRINEGIKTIFGVEIKMRQFYEEADSLNKIVDYIEKHLSEDWSYDSEKNGKKEDLNHSININSDYKAPDISSPQIGTQINCTHSGSLQSIMEKQLQAMSSLMNQQLEFLKNNNIATSYKNALPQVDSYSKDLQDKKQDNIDKEAEIAKHMPPSAITLRAMKFEQDQFTEQQQAFIEQFIDLYSKKTKKSKEYSQKHRKPFCDWINTLNFRLSIKEIQYPIVAPSSLGSKLWDIDGNKYIDMAMGYGVSFFGNRPEFITKAIKKQIDTGYELAPQTDLAGDVATLICELTGVERVAFCNTGSEAVMTVTRIARAVTGKKKIVLFTGSYHGNSDGVLAIPTEYGTVPTSPGTMHGMVEDLIILNYGIPESLDIIKDHAHELAAVLVEPVQSRRPGFHPKEFLKELREFTLKNNIVLIFDEVITGFRQDPGGAQAFYGIRADLVTYGKIVGGGMPIGVVAGKAKYMNYVDGGIWQFGDNSCPGENVIFFAGTFCKHPLAMSAAKAGLSFMKEKGPALQQGVNKKTDYFVKTLNDFFAEQKVAIRIAHFGSLFRFESFGKYHLALAPIEMELFFYILMFKGVYTWERRICFFSIAHTDEDIEYIIEKVKETIYEMRAGGFMIEEEGYDPKVLILPVSSAQKRLFVINEFEQGETTYRILAAFMIKGKLDLNRLENSFQELIKRHEMLRTGFELENEEPVQKIYKDVEFSIDYKKGTNQEIDQIIKDFIQNFDLSKPPLMRICIAEIETQNKDEYLMVFDSHHIAVDGLSANILVQELVTIYEGHTLEPLTKNYKDYVFLQNKALKTDRMQQHQSYWLNRLSGDLPIIELPCDYSRPAVRSSKGGIVYSNLSEHDTAKLKDLSASKSSTINMVLMAAYNILLHKLTHQEDIIVGIPVSGRPGGFENIIGMFANTLAIRNKPQKDKTFSKFLETLKINALNDYDNQDYPFELLINDLNLERDVSRNALFDVMFVYEKADERVFDLKELTFNPYEIKLETTQFDLSLETIEQKGIINLTLEYSKDLFKRSTIERWLQYFKNIVKEIISNPDIKISDIDMLSDEEKFKLLVEFNRGVKQYPDNTIVNLFEKQVKNAPNAIALTCEDKSLTYKQLNQMANNIAFYLKDVHKIGQEDMVALLLDRSEWMVIGLLGVLKAGGVCVPIDPVHPKERREFMIKDSTSKVVLADSQYIESIDIEELQNNIVDIQSIKGTFDNDPDVTIHAENAAYIFYTSGTTGFPKGCVLEHKSICDYILTMTEECKVTSDDVVLQQASIGFDTSMEEIFATLCSGASLIISKNSMDLDSLLSQIIFHNVTLVSISPLAANYINNFPDKIKDSCLRLIICGGDALQASFVDNLYNNIEIMNSYGPSESTVAVTLNRIKNLDDAVLIGKPITNRTIYILDDLKPVPMGVTGEIHIGGKGLFRGYLNQNALTKEKLIPNPFGSNSFKQDNFIFKTGDIGRWTAAGDIEFIGRDDDQVKIRGYRIEIQEIERRILEHHAIKEAAVIAVEIDKTYGKDLVAYIVKKSAHTNTDIRELKEYLKGFLPSYMIPTYFVMIDRLPINSNGKLDKKALPNPVKHSLNKNTIYVPPKTKTEKMLENIWSTILDRSEIGIYDNFFEMGGQSIKAMMMVFKIRKEFQVKFELQDIFTYPAIAGQSDLIDKRQKSSCFSDIKPISSQEYYDLSNAQKRLWIIDQMEEKSTAYNMHGAYLLKGNLNITAFKKGLQFLIDRHEVLRTVFINIDGTPKQKILEKSQLYISEIDLSLEDMPEQKAKELYIKEAEEYFDLEKGPLFRTMLIKISKQSYIFVINAHHIIFDGWTHDILVEELSKAYFAYCNDKAPDIPELKIQYKEYSEWINKFLNSQDINIHKEYWLKNLSQDLPVLNLNTDYPRPDQKRFKGKFFKLPVDENLAYNLIKLSQNKGVTLFMTLVGAVNVMLYKYTGQQDIILGMPSAGRIHPDLENQVGFYLNMLPIRTILQDSDTLKTVIEKVKVTTTNAYAHEIYPYDNLVEDLDLKRDPSRNPIFDVIVNMNDFDKSGIELHGIEVSPFAEESMTSRADLDFIFEQSKNKELIITIEYDTDLFKETSVEKIGKDLITVLQAFVDNINMPVSKIWDIFMTPEEQENQQQFLDSIMEIQEDF